MNIAYRTFKPTFNFFASKKALSGKDKWVNQFNQTPAMLHFPGETFHCDSIVTIRPDGADIGTHTAPGHYIDIDSVFFQHLNDSDVRQTSGTSGRKRKAD